MDELIIKDGNEVLLSEAITHELIRLEKAKEHIKRQEENLRNILLKEMEENNIIKIDSERLLINYVASSDREYFDKKNFQKENPDLYDKYVSIRSIKPQLKIKVKKNG